MSEPHSAADTAQKVGQKVKVWDWSIRVFHWSLPILLFALWYTRIDTDVHMIFAQILMGVLVYRLIWGVIGTPYARFGHFLYGPQRFWQYLIHFFSQNKPVYLSHNPMGGVMVLVLLGALSFQLITGLFTNDWIFPGPLSQYVSSSTAQWMMDWHHRFFDYLLILIGLHLTAILVYRIKGEGLVWAMLSGRKKVGAEGIADAAQQPIVFPWWRFVLAVGLSLASVGWVFHYLA